MDNIETQFPIPILIPILYPYLVKVKVKVKNASTIKRFHGLTITMRFLTFVRNDKREKDGGRMTDDRCFFRETENGERETWFFAVKSLNRAIVKSFLGRMTDDR